MSQEIKDFWVRNNTPIGVMRLRAPKRLVKPHQVEIAARIVYEEVQDIIYNVPEIKVLTSDRQLERIILLRNQLKPAMLGKSVFRVAPFVGAKEEDTEKAIAQTRVKELEARLEAGRWHQRIARWFNTWREGAWQYGAYL
jgi:hypothetical protein